MNKILKHIKINNIEYLEFNKLNELGINNCFTLKPFNFSFNYQDEIALLNNFKTICNIKGFNLDKLTRPKQNHSDNIKIVNDKYGINDIVYDNVDALITNQKNTPLAITSADCNTITLYDEKNKVIALIHSGWKGTLKDITSKTLDTLVSSFNTDPKDVYVFFSPSICHKCFEVEKDVYSLFKDKYSYLDNINKIITYKGVINGKDKYLIDTILLIKTLLINKGIKKANIFESNICTLENNNIMHSYRARKEKAFGLNITIVSL